MKISRIVYSIILIFLIKTNGFAQVSILETADMTNVKVEAISDDQLNAMLAKARQSNASEEDVYEIFRQKGLPDEEINKLKIRISGLNNFKNNNTQPDKKSKEKNESARSYDKDANKLLMQENNRDLTIFGAELFAQNSLVFEPNLRIPTPTSYILGPDDEVILNIFGLSEKKYNLDVNEEGEVYIPNVGPMFVSGLSIEQATQKIKTKLASTIYRALNSGQTKMQLSLGKIRSIRVTVIGQAQKPGTYTVSSLTTLYNILYLCGGPGSKGSYRAIEIIRGNQVKRVADLYSFLTKGDQKDNVLLQEGDVIRIPYYKNRVKVSGNVKREGKYEMAENENLETLLDYAGGFDERAFKSSITVIRLTDTGKNIIDVKNGQFSKFTAAAGDEYFIRKNRDNFKNKVSVSGSVSRPGTYELTEGLTLQSLIEKSGGLTEDAYSKNASIFRTEKNRVPTIFTVSIDSVLNYNQSVLLQNEDSVSIHSIFDFRDSMYVQVEGFVRKPMAIKWRENMSLKDVILATGGITEFGDSANIEISRRAKQTNVNALNKIEAESKIAGISSDVILEPFDLIVVKGIAGYISQRSVMVMGDVNVPGRYILQTSGDRISDIIKRFKGFKASADSSVITIRRSIKSNLSLKEREEIFQRLLNIDSDSLIANQKLRNEIYKSYELISVNISKILSNTSSSENLILEDGDVLTIDKNSNLVKISGDVYYPTIVPFKEGKRAKYYIKQAGNYTQSGRKSGTIVIYPDGKAKGVKSFLFFKRYPRVTTRSEVFVPQKNRSNRQRISGGELAVILSALGILANVFTSVIK